MVEPHKEKTETEDSAGHKSVDLHVIDVIPITRGITVEKLTYFTAENVAPGSIVSVPLRKKIVSGIVVGVGNAAEAKAHLRNVDFEIKKATALCAREFFLPEFIETCKKAADYFASSTGAILHAVTPQTLIEQIPKMTSADYAIKGVGAENFPKKSGANRATSAGTTSEKFALQAPDDERYSHYKSFVREQFARKSSVFFCLPDIQETELAAGLLEKGIEGYVFVLHSNLTDKELIARCKRLLTEPHPVLIVATGSFLSLPRADIGAIILEKATSRGWKTLGRPFLDFRLFAELLAQKIGAQLVVGDLFLSTETIYRHRAGEFQELYPLKFRLLSTAKNEIIDMRTNKDNRNSDHNDTGNRGDKSNFAAAHFIAIGGELAALIDKNRVEKGHLFIFTARKGLSPTTVCADCGTIVTCNSCHHAVVLHGGVSNFFLCHHCGERRNADDVCKSCGGWRLKTLGIGTELVADEITRLCPELSAQKHIFIFDKEKIRSHKEALAMITDFYHSPGSVLVGTEMALGYLDKPVENSAVASMDSFFSIPDFRINEKILGILLAMRMLTERRFLIQTRDPEQKTFGHALRGNLLDFYRDELALREMFGYPPFAVFIKISLEGKREQIAEEMAYAKKFFAGETGTENGDSYELDVFPSFIKSARGNSILQGLIKVPLAKWRKDKPDEKLLSKLRSLPASYAINVDPESLL